MSTKNKTILITGANSEIATNYIKAKNQDYTCIIAHYGHRHDRIDELKDVFRNKLVPISADLASEAEVDNLAGKMKSYEIDEFLHIAAPKLRYMRFAKANRSEFELEMQVVYWSFFQVCQAIIPNMLKRGKGRVVSILTEYTVTNQPPYLSHYISAKFALLGLIKSLAGEYAVKGIRINAISPGMIETDFVSQLPQYVINDNAKSTIRGRNLTPDDLIPTISYLLSEESGSINGQNILLQ